MYTLEQRAEGKMRILYVGDAGCPSGFARATHEILSTVHHLHQVTVLGINYRGDPNPYPYPMYTAAAGGDMFGVGRLIFMCDVVQPDVIVVQNDGWNIPPYIRELRRCPEFADVPVIAIVAVDGKNFQGKWLEGVAHAIFWTEFAMLEAREGGYAGPASVIPLGVDLAVYHQIDREQARVKIIPSLLDKFIVGNVNRNQPRKRWDLTLEYFAYWVQTRGVDDAYLFLHVAPTGDTGADVQQLAKYYGVLNRLALRQPAIWYGVSEQEMCETYNLFDVQITTTQGEGFGLTTLEGMACAVPQIVPAWAALEELTEDAAYQVGCPTTAIGPPYVNVIGGVPDKQMFVEALDEIYRNRETRERYSHRGLSRVQEPRFRWSHIGARYAEVLERVLTVEHV